MPTPTIPPKPVPPPPTTPKPIAATQFRRIINTGAAPMRTSPSTSASIITKIPHGQIAGILNLSLSGTWYRVTYRNKTGYVLKSKTQPISLVGTTLASQYVRVIVVARQQQHLEVWDHGKLMIISAVTTGRPDLPTPLGTTQVLKKQSPKLFQSPWAWPNQYWYPPGWADFAILFRSGGFFFHDTEYRPENGYGIGTNVLHTDPDGVERTGSRGCVNTPYWAVRQLYGWSVVGDRVVVVDG
jgi:lipoprotein-anchoring transpeptidase ErfK/SrfK